MSGTILERLQCSIAMFSLRLPSVSEVVTSSGLVEKVAQDLSLFKATRWGLGKEIKQRNGFMRVITNK
jgi:hypothetical protein